VSIIAFCEQIHRSFKVHVANNLTFVSCDFCYRKTTVANCVFELVYRIANHEKYRQHKRGKTAKFNKRAVTLDDRRNKKQRKRDENTGDVVVDTGTSNALLPRAEQIPGEELYVGDRVKVFVSEVGKAEEKGPMVMLSRTHPAMVKRMFETDIPEVKDGIVLVKGISREAGSRTKIAVLSRDENVDAVGACIGNRGMRIAEIVNELHGEKIDVIEFSEYAEKYIAAALSPATVREVEFDGERSAKVLVDGDQLSLAIGKEGQNVRLAAKLTGYKIDIKGVKI